MSATISVEEAQAHLKELIHQLAPGEEVVITENRQPVAKLVSEKLKPQLLQRPGPGAGKGMITFIAPDFDAPLEDLKEYSVESQENTELQPRLGSEGFPERLAAWIKLHPILDHPVDDSRESIYAGCGE